MVCHAHSRQELKSLEKLQDFFFKTNLNVPDQDHFCPRGASKPKPWKKPLDFVGSLDHALELQLGGSSAIAWKDMAFV